MTRSLGNVTWIGGLVLLVVIVGIAGARLSGTAHFYAFAVIASGVITFFGLLRVGPIARDAEIPENRMRTAITAGFLISYLVLVGLAAFIRESAQLSDFTRTLLSSYTGIVGVVVAFYFGASAYVEARQQSAAQRPSSRTADPDRDEES